MITKQDKDPYIWDYNIKVKTKDGYNYEDEEDIEIVSYKEKVKKLEKTKN